MSQIMLWIFALPLLFTPGANAQTGAGECVMEYVWGSLAVPVKPRARNPQLEIWHLAESGHTAAAEQAQAQFENILGHGDMRIEGKISRGSAGALLVTLDNGIRALWKPYQNGGLAGGANEIAAYLVDRKLGYHLVPVTVERFLNGRRGTLQAFVEDAEPRYQSEREAINGLKFFDHLITNDDGNPGNHLTVAGREVSIDHELSLELGSAKVIRTQWERDVSSLLRLMNANKERQGILTKYLAIDPHSFEERSSLAALKKQYLAWRGELATLLPPQRVYDALKNTTALEWRELLTPYVNSPKIMAFLENKDRAQDLLDEAYRLEGSDVFPVGPFSNPSERMEANEKLRLHVRPPKSPKNP